MTRDPGFWIWTEALELLRNAERLQQRFVARDAVHRVPYGEPAVDRRHGRSTAAP